MANTFKRKSISSVSTSQQAVLASAVGASTEVVVIGMLAANKSAASTEITVEIYIDSSTSYTYAYQLPIPPNSSLECLVSKLVLVTGDNVYVTAGNASAVDFTLSYLEIT